MRPVIAVLILLMLGLAATASGQEAPPEPLVQNVQDPCPTYDSCTMSNHYQGDYGTGGLIPQACKLNKCRTCNDDTRRCTSVRLNAYCTCDDLPVQGAGPYITYCGNMAGACLYTAY